MQSEVYHSDDKVQCPTQQRKNNVTNKETSMFKKLGAVFYDGLILTSLLLLFSLIAVSFNHGQAIPPHTLWYQLLLLAVVFFYSFGLLCSSGQTMGMKTWRLKLVDEQGQPPSFSQLVKRLILMLPAFLVGSCTLTRPERWLNRWTACHFV